jgi:hypothetical protein
MIKNIVLLDMTLWLANTISLNCASPQEFIESYSFSGNRNKILHSMTKIKCSKDTVYKSEILYMFKNSISEYVVNIRGK